MVKLIFNDIRFKFDPKYVVERKLNIRKISMEGIYLYHIVQIRKKNHI